MPIDLQQLFCTYLEKGNETHNLLHPQHLLHNQEFVYKNLSSLLHFEFSIGVPTLFWNGLHFQK